MSSHRYGGDIKSPNQDNKQDGICMEHFFYAIKVVMVLKMAQLVNLLLGVSDDEEDSHDDENCQACASGTRCF